MTDTNEKIRSLFLTALMVFSVFAGTIAFSGGAAAASNVGIDQAVEYTANSGPSGDSTTVEIMTNNTLTTPVTGSFVPDDSNAGEGDVTVFIDGDENPDNYVSGSNAAISSAGTDGSSDGRVVIRLSKDVEPSRNLTVKLHDVSANPSKADKSAVVAEDIDVTSKTFTQSGSYTQDNNVFRGEAIAVEYPGASGNTDIEVEEDDGGIVSSDTYTANSDVYVVETGNLDTGQSYNISIDGQKEESFTLSDLDLQANIDDDVGDGANIDDTDTLAVNVSTNRGGPEANATLFDADGDKVAESDLNGPNNPQFKALQGNNNVVFNFGNVSADDSPYYVKVTDNRTGVTTESDQINVSESDDGDASFETSTVQEEIGDVANITVQMSNTDEATINVGTKEDSNYYIQGDLTDDNGDGEVTVQFNSYTAGTDGSNTVLSVPGDDEIDNVNEGGTFSNRADLEADTLDTGSYSINVTAGSSPDFTSPDSVGTLQLSENSVENVQTWAAPSDAEIDDDDVDVYDRIGENLTESDDLAVEDVVVHQVQASGIEGALEFQREDQSASDATEAFIQAVDLDGQTDADANNGLSTGNNNVDGTAGSNGVDAGLTLYLNRTDVGANANERVAVLNSSNTVVVDDPDNNTYFVAVDTGELDIAETDVPSDIGDDGVSVRDEEDVSFNATFAVKSDSPLSDDGKSASALFTTSERNTNLNLDDDDLVTVSAATGQEVSGTTNVAPGSELEVEMESENDANPFVIRPETEVATDGTYTATADFSDYSAGTNFTVRTLDVDGSNAFSDEEDGRIVAADTATVSISDQESDGSEVVVDSAQLSEGGFIAVHAGNASGDVVGNSEYLEAGSHEDVTITLDEPMDEDFTAVAMPHLDTNGNEAYDFPDADGPYTSNGTAVTDSANVTIVEETQTEAPDTETETEAPDTETEAPDTETEAMDTETEEAETTAAEGPGFTAAIALIALVAAALLAVRRDN